MEILGVSTITDLKQGVKDPNRVNVFIDGAFAFSLDVAQVVDLKVKVGRKLSGEELEELKRASEFGKAYQRALEWVLVRPRSVRELKDYLKRSKYKKEMEERKKEWQVKDDGRERKRERTGAIDFSGMILERIVERGYVDDKKFAEWYVENRFVKKGVSKKRLKMELAEKGVSREIIDEVVDMRDDEEEIEKILLKKRAKYDDEKLIGYLCRQGFSYDLAKEMVKKEASAS
ncbi:RecX family transcriptional regulator [Candidatus Saccharibacteria bacterium]|nr:RecX family transcriptional regulator [Candidatus Saccharibacteria bacterium]